MYIERTLEKIIESISKKYSVLLINGPRQVGKTTILQHLSKKNRTYVTLDDPILAQLAKDEPKMFIERFPPPVLIDEIQYAPNLFPYIKMHVDDNKKSGAYWLTGSQHFRLMKNVSETLAGRVAILNLLGLSNKELENKGKSSKPFIPEKIKNYSEKSNSRTLKTVYKRIWRGSFPKISADRNMDRDLFYSSYLKTYLERDVRDLTKIGDESSFIRFLKSIAARTANLINLSEIAKDVDVSPNTVKNWLSILQTSGLVYLLNPFFNNITQRLIKAPKLYFLDTGLCSYLAGWTTPEALEAGVMSGAIFETYVISEIIKSYWHNGKEFPGFFYRDKDSKEIDLLIVQNQNIYPIEIKKTTIPSKKHVKHFSLLDKFKETVETGALICMNDKITPLKENINALNLYNI